MTTDKARKRATRERMSKTGERYAAARRHTIAKLPQRCSRSRGWPTGRSARAAAGRGTSGSGSSTTGAPGADAPRHRAVAPGGARRAGMVGADRDGRLRARPGDASVERDVRRLLRVRVEDGIRSTW